MTCLMTLQISIQLRLLNLQEFPPVVEESMEKLSPGE